jgi:hypothetical protein
VNEYRTESPNLINGYVAPAIYTARKRGSPGFQDLVHDQATFIEPVR